MGKERWATRWKRRPVETSCYTVRFTDPFGFLCFPCTLALRSPPVSVSLWSPPTGSAVGEDEHRESETEGERREGGGIPRDSILFTLNLFIPHAFVIFILFVFHLLRLVQGKLYRYSPRLIENLPKAGINLGFSLFICRTFIIGGFY